MTTTEAALRDAAEQARNFTNRIAHGCWGNGYITEAKEIAHRLAVALSQPSPASSTVGEARAILDRVPVSEFPGKSYEDRLANARKVYAAISLSSGEPASVAVEAEKIEAIIKAQMREWWDDICQDTGCHPLDFERRGKQLWYDERHWTQAVAKYAAQDILALSKPTPVEAGLRLDRDVIAYSIIEGSGGIRAAEHAKDFKTANWTDALRSADAVIVALAALSETQPPRETSTQEKQNG